MATDDLREREKEYLTAARLRAQAEKLFSEEFLLAKTQEGVTDRMAEHMATTRIIERLAEAKALEVITRKRLDAS